jgi:hypothetical protein
MSKDKDVTFKITIPTDWSQQLETIAQENNTSKMAIISQAIAQYLVVDYDKFYLTSKLEKMSAELDNLRQKITQIEPHTHQITILNNRLTILEKTLAAMSGEVVLNQSFAEPLNDEDWEDEPDEILTDFLP